MGPRAGEHFQKQVSDLQIAFALAASANDAVDVLDQRLELFEQNLIGIAGCDNWAANLRICRPATGVTPEWYAVSIHTVTSF